MFIRETAKTTGTVEKSERSAQDYYQLVCFRLKDIDYGLEVSCVEEIIRPRDINETLLPDGVASRRLSWRGRDLNLMDLRVRLGYPHTSADDETRIIIVSIENRLFGAIVDSVSELIRAHPAKIDDALKPGPGSNRDLIKGVFRDDERSVFILDAVRVFDPEE